MPHLTNLLSKSSSSSKYRGASYTSVLLIRILLASNAADVLTKEEISGFNQLMAITIFFRSVDPWTVYESAFLSYLLNVILGIE